MPRKKKPDAQTDIAPTTPIDIEPDASTRIPRDRIEDQARPQWARAFKSILTIRRKGVTVGVRDGHDWVIGMPEDPGPEIKAALTDAGFAYRSRDRKWTTFTHAPTRPRVEALAKKLKSEFGDDMTVADYPVRQVVIAFDSNPGEDVISKLKDKGFHYRPDQTWNADFTKQAQDLALAFAQSLPDQQRSLAG